MGALGGLGATLWLIENLWHRTLFWMLVCQTWLGMSCSPVDAFLICKLVASYRCNGVAN